jgi:hypothetical protein
MPVISLEDQADAITLDNLDLEPEVGSLHNHVLPIETFVISSFTKSS